MGQLGNVKIITLPKNSYYYGFSVQKYLLFSFQRTVVPYYFTFSVQLSHIILSWENCKNPLFKPFLPVVPYNFLSLGKMGINAQFVMRNVWYCKRLPALWEPFSNWIFREGFALTQLLARIGLFRNPTLCCFATLRQEWIIAPQYELCSAHEFPSEWIAAVPHYHIP